MNTLYPPLLIGGAEKSVSLLAEALVRSGDEVSVISLHPGRVMQIGERNGVRVYRVPLRNLYWPFGQDKKRNAASRVLWHLLDLWNPYAAKDVGYILDIEKPDVVHTNNISGFSVAVFREVRRRNIRLVHTLRDYYMLCARYTLFRDGKVCEGCCAGCRILTGNHSAASRYPDAVVANSQYVLSAHQRGGFFAGVPSSVIFNIAGRAVDEGNTAGCSSAGEQLVRCAGAIAPSLQKSGRAALHGEDTLVFGFIGKVEAEKGIEVLLAATKLLAHPNWRLRIAGKGLDGYVAALQHHFRDPRIEWLGFREASRFYRSIDVSVVSSVWAEPLPRTLIEAFAARKSAICARSGGILEIASLGKVIETYAATDATALARVMDQALADTGRWRDGGWRNKGALGLFSEKAIVSDYHEVYRNRQVGVAVTGSSGYEAAPVSADRGEMQPTPETFRRSSTWGDDRR